MIYKQLRKEKHTVEIDIVLSISPKGKRDLRGSALTNLDKINKIIFEWIKLTDFV